MGNEVLPENDEEPARCGELGGKKDPPESKEPGANERPVGGNEGPGNEGPGRGNEEPRKGPEGND